MYEHLLKSTLFPTTELPQNFTNLPNSSINGVVVGAWTVAPGLLLMVCFMVGVPVNVAVVIDICRKYKRYASKVNPNILLLVVNLAVVDSVTLSTAPFFAFPLIWGFNLGDASCKMFFFTITSCLFISVVTVTAISMNYFLIVKFAVANPRIMAQVRRGRGTVLFLGGVWAGALLLSISTLFTRRVEERNGLLRCVRKAANDTEKVGALNLVNTVIVAMLFLETVVGFILPFLVLLTSYVCLYRNTAQRVSSATSTEQRKKLNHFVVSVLVTFLICWTPYHIINMVDVSTTLSRVSSPEVYKLLKYFRNPAGDSMKSLCLFNSVMNPFFYAFTLRKNLNKSRDSLTCVTTDMSVEMATVHNRSCKSPTS